MASDTTQLHLVSRHIQDHNSAKSFKYYWGYPSRVVPCTNDAGSCEYLDAVYWMHTVSMLYTFILWAVIGGILLLIIISRLFRPRRNAEEGARQSFAYRLWRSLSSATRRYLLPESLPKIFPNSTKLQVLILATLCIYLTIFSLVGIVYKTWITPVKNSSAHNTRTGLGGFADRVGALAYALTPLTIGLSTRDSILSLLTGVPYQHFNFLHRWTGRIILVQSFLHTIGWTIVEGRLYQPQPKVYKDFIKQTYMIWGIVAQGFICFLFVFSLRPVIRWTGYEFFRKSHLIIAGLYLGACWGHWSKLACWMIASLGLLGLDLGLRTARMLLIHLGYKDGNKGLGFRAIQANVEVFKDPSGTIVRLDFTHNHPPWKVGQHFYLTFPALSIWQSHPFTPASVPPTALVPPKHTYIIRARRGETGKLATLAEHSLDGKPVPFSTPAILAGPYGTSALDREASNILAIAGGTGISFTLPIVTAALTQHTSIAQNIELIWIVRHVENIAWIGPELNSLKDRLGEGSVGATESTEDAKAPPRTCVCAHPNRRFRIRVFVTRASETPTSSTHLPHAEKDPEISSASTSASSALSSHPDLAITHLNHTHPNLSSLLDAFLTSTVESGRTLVAASGPAALGTDLRAAVAARNKALGVWRGDEKGDVALLWDDRMG